MRYPSEQDWIFYDTYMAEGRSATKAALKLDALKDEVIKGMMRVSDWLRVSGWSDKYAEGIRNGFSEADARLHADQAADFRMRQLNGEE